MANISTCGHPIHLIAPLYLMWGSTCWIMCQLADPFFYVLHRVDNFWAKLGLLNSEFKKKKMTKQLLIFSNDLSEQHSGVKFGVKISGLCHDSSCKRADIS